MRKFLFCLFALMYKDLPLSSYSHWCMIDFLSCFACIDVRGYFSFVSFALMYEDYSFCSVCNDLREFISLHLPALMYKDFCILFSLQCYMGIYFLCFIFVDVWGRLVLVHLRWCMTSPGSSFSRMYEETPLRVSFRWHCFSFKLSLSCSWQNSFLFIVSFSFYMLYPLNARLSTLSLLYFSPAISSLLELTF